MDSAIIAGTPTQPSSSPRKSFAAGTQPKSRGPNFTACRARYMCFPRHLGSTRRCKPTSRSTRTSHTTLDAPETAAAPGAGATANSRLAIASWPTKLVDEPVERKIRADGDDLAPAQDQRRSSQATNPSRRSGGPCSRTGPATSIRTFAAAFLRMAKEQRAHAPIDLPGVADADRYRYAFKRIPQWSIEPLRSPRVFYAQLRWTAELDDGGTSYSVQLHAGDWTKPVTKNAIHGCLRPPGP